VARGLQVFITTKRFGKGPHYSNGASATLPRPTSYTPELARAARELLGRIYRRGYGYKKAGVMLFDLTAERPEQGHLFIEADPTEGALMEAVDQVNQAYGRRSVQLAGAGLNRAWAMQRRMTSPAYTTRWSDLPVARA
jgi:DNA polymerase V